jgi:hypothetical protein
MRTAALVLSVAVASAATPCLCVFDVDRTLTGLQSDVKDCPANTIIPGSQDCGYAGGTLTLSEFTPRFAQTFCAGCHTGICSAGTACGSDSKERALIVATLNSTGLLPAAATWSAPGKVTSPLVTSYPERHKQVAVAGILNWYAEQGITIADGDVHFFDDRPDNIGPFNGTGFNARQISCATRDPNKPVIGLCGATPEEIVAEKGIVTCPVN